MPGVPNPFAALLASRRRTADLRAARGDLLGDPYVVEAERTLLAKIELRVHRDDQMYAAGAGRHYLGVGLSALRCIEALRGGRPEPDTVLDFAAGYGRVLRFLTVRHPDASITAAEIDRTALRFCRRTFGVSTVESREDVGGLSLAGRYDLIWCGSLLTHLSQSGAADVLGFFARHLTPDGVCVASVHGEVTIDALRSGVDRYGLGGDAVRRILSGFDRDEYGHAEYEGMTGYGISIATPARIADLAARAGLVATGTLTRGWDDHHDVYALRRSR